LRHKWGVNLVGEQQRVAEFFREVEVEEDIIDLM
jgi:hypothetical protein